MFKKNAAYFLLAVAVLTGCASNPERRAADAGVLAEKIRAALRGELSVPAATPLSTPSPTKLLPVPAAPRALPGGFRKKYVPDAAFKLMFSLPPGARGDPPRARASHPRPTCSAAAAFA